MMIRNLGPSSSSFRIDLTNLSFFNLLKICISIRKKVLSKRSNEFDYSIRVILHSNRLRSMCKPNYRFCFFSSFLQTIAKCRQRIIRMYRKKKQGDMDDKSNTEEMNTHDMI